MSRARTVVVTVLILLVGQLLFVAWYALTLASRNAPPSSSQLFIGLGVWVVVLLLGTFLTSRQGAIERRRENRIHEIEEKMKSLEGPHPELALTLGVIDDMLQVHLDLAGSRSFVGNLAQNAVFLSLGFIIPLVVTHVFS